MAVSVRTSIEWQSNGCTFRGDTAPCSRVLFGDDGTQCQGKGGKDAPMPSGWKTAFCQAVWQNVPKSLKELLSLSWCFHV